MTNSVITRPKVKWSLPTWYYLLFALVLVVHVFGTLLLQERAEETLDKMNRISDSLENITHNTHLYHLWLEEYLMTPEKSSQRKLLNNIDQAHMEYAELKGLVKTHEWNQEGFQIIFYTDQLGVSLDGLFDLGKKRLKTPGVSAVSSPIDDAFDELFSQLMREIKELKAFHNRIFGEELTVINDSKRLMFVFVFILMLGIWVTLRIVDRRRAVLLKNLYSTEIKERKKETQYRELLEESIADKNNLLRQKEKVRLIFEQAPLGIIEWTPDFEVVMWNQAAEDIFGYSEKESLGRNAQDLILNEELMLDVTNTIRELTNDTGGYRSVNYNLTKDGTIILCEWYNTPLLDSDNNVVGISSLVMDVSEKHQLEQSHHRLVRMLQNSTDLVGIANNKGYIVYLNNTGREMIGFTKDELVEKMNVKNFLAKKESIYMQNNIIPRLIKQGVAVRENLTFLNREGDDIPTSSIIMLEMDEKNNITHYMISARDLREERQTQAKLEHVQRLESLGVLAGGIAHDFNNILTGILGNTALASNSLDETSPIRSYLQNVEISSQRAADLCKQMLAYSGKGKFIITIINLNNMINETMRLMDISIDKGVVIKYHLAENLPMVEGDVAQLQQVLMNLVINASEAIEGKSGVISITTGVMSVDASYLKSTSADEENTPAGRYVFLEVSDTGCGMDKNTQNKIFDPFFTTKFTGRGLGMSATLGIVHGHSGSIKIYSEVSKGTTFKVLLPHSNESDQGDHKVKQDAKEIIEMSGSVLIVDDEETIREVAGMMLEEMGFNVLKANDGHEGVTVFHQHHKEIQVVLLDMTMPRMDGVEAFREMQRIDSGVKVILSSGYNEQDATNRFAGKGLAGFIQKPYLPNALQQTVRDILSK